MWDVCRKEGNVLFNNTLNTGMSVMYLVGKAVCKMAAVMFVNREMNFNSKDCRSLFIYNSVTQFKLQLVNLPSPTLIMC